MGVLFLCHLMGAAFCALLIAGYEAERLWRDPSPIHLLKRVLAVAPAIAVPVVLYLLSPLAPLQRRHGLAVASREGTPAAVSFCRLRPVVGHRHRRPRRRYPAGGALPRPHPLRRDR